MGVLRLNFPAESGLLVGGAFGPFVGAFVAVYRTGGWAAVREFARRTLRYRAGLPVIGASLFLVPALALGAAFLRAKSGGPPFALAVSLADVPLLFVTLLVVGGSVEEEFGWAYAIDGMQRMWGLLPAAMALGVIWGCWHIPLFFVAGLAQSYMPFWSFLTMTVSLRTMYVWAYESTQKSILVTLLFHTSTNLAFNLVTLLDYSPRRDESGFVYFALLSTIPAACVALGSRLYRRSPPAEAMSED
jgi:membrane protease YdiL (CAAX protease family)